MIVANIRTYPIDSFDLSLSFTKFISASPKCSRKLDIAVAIFFHPISQSATTGLPLTS
jgi:hypothetical protein